jgi:hypothetical protein
MINYLFMPCTQAKLPGVETINFNEKDTLQALKCARAVLAVLCMPCQWPHAQACSWLVCRPVATCFAGCMRQSSVAATVVHTCAPASANVSGR